MPTSLLLLSFLTLASLPAVTLAARPKNAILLSEVQSLTLHANRKTTSRRVPAIPQLRCTSAPALCRLADVRTLRCTNQGASYTAQDVEWACTAPGGLPAAVRLDATEVICEGYESADDAYVLRGSCGVEYTLRLTEEGARQYPELARLGGGGIDWTEYVFGAVIVLVAAWILWSTCVTGRGSGRRLGGGRRSGGGGGGWGGGGGGGWGPGWGPGGGGGGGWDDPPPPYPGPGPKPSSSSTTEQAWRPGFWSGLASGAAAGYMAGSRGQRNDNERYYGRRGGLWGGDGGGFGGWGAGSGTGWTTGRSSGSSSSGSGARHESTGYGSTSRR
ncbi:uncharacterized protein THITE_2130565 [Thermothielavioides terrestris NRRL 8126]|uniref:Store-operated calcium entry-associated regulatory factor n=1 Tax=Thermothielavioides terrestris (strain ATCC 38088 / NRRL 8126) TaxID=578455 RepID=G2RAJ8_THETT|nr:uncharacterized protein THITE_2130565 [Thermothielavioides terrestris NRRL 8126]AEO68876.1 hypothetical protein THITE_2130565 [Thermothielavioides terrestris NRRL 8126]